MTQPTSRENARKTVGEILKHVDQLIKAGNIEESVREIIRATEVDSTNPYIHAYEERLAYLKEEHERNAAKERTRKEAEQAARLRDEELQRTLEEERKRKEAEQKDQESQSKPVAERPVDPPKKKEDAGPQENTGREEAIRETPAISTSSVGPLDRGLANRAERRLESEGGVARRPLNESRAIDILLIDDEEAMRTIIGEVLTDHGYHVTSLSTTDEALVLLKKWKPGLILCDVDLKTSTMGGFTFFEKVQDLGNLNDVPFLFLTGLTDEIIMNRGKELGADDYLTKPVSEQDLISTVKGKLRRYSRLNKGKRQDGA